MIGITGPFRGDGDRRRAACERELTRQVINLLRESGRGSGDRDESASGVSTIMDSVRLNELSVMHKSVFQRTPM